jgi:Flp pilus assembly protein TadD
MPRAPAVALLVCVGLLAAVLVTYGSSLANKPVWDDGPLVVDNPFLRTFAGLGRLWSTDLWSASANTEQSSYYRPFTMFTFWLNVNVAGRSAAALRLGNILIHAANAMLLALFARKAHALSWRSAGLVALLFAVAPVCSEPVLWISGRFDLLVVTFALLALVAGRMQGRAGLALGLASVAAGLLSKESFVGWLPLMFLDDVFVNARLPARRLLTKYAAVAAIVAAYFVGRKIIGIPSLDVLTHAGPRVLAESFCFLIATFLRELAWPSTLNPFRPYITPSPVSLALIAASIAVLVAAPLFALRHQRTNPRSRLAAFGVAWFLLATVPSSVVGPTLAMVGDRYAYLPSIGLFLVAMAILGELDQRHVAGVARKAIVATILGVAVACAARIVVRARDWHDDNALAMSSLASDPESPYPLYWLGTEAAEHGQLDLADQLLARSLARNPESWRTWNAICYVRLNQNRLAEGERACKHAIDLLAVNPRMWVNLASIYVREGRWNDALTSADHALALKPGYVEAHYLAAVSAANLGMLPMASEHVQAGLAVQPSHPRLRALAADLERFQREHPPQHERPLSPPAPGP